MIGGIDGFRVKTSMPVIAEILKKIGFEVKLKEGEVLEATLKGARMVSYPRNPYR